MLSAVMWKLLREEQSAWVQAYIYDTIGYTIFTCAKKLTSIEQ